MAMNTSKDSLPELLPSILTRPQLKIPPHPISPVKEPVSELLPF
jgi:hypothetical protein